MLVFPATTLPGGTRLGFLDTLVRFSIGNLFAAVHRSALVAECFHSI
jgi:hypothetical protein